ncbi:MAG: FAD-dependent oxidoreductase [Silvibacterium sp.]
MQQVDIAIAGAGIIGLAAALEFASAGASVTVFERGQAMRESSWAAAGMLAAHDPENPSALQPLSELSLSLYPEFLAKVESLSGKSIPILSTQTLQGMHSLPPNARLLSAETIQALAPGLQANGLEFFLLEEQSFDPRDLALALPTAAQAAGVTLHEQTAVTAVHSQSGSIHVQTTSGSCTASHFINACGAWAADLTGIPVTPRKGQILMVEHPDLYADQHLAAVIRTPHLYLLPRKGQRVLIGATVEHAGYDKHVDPAAITALHAAAAALFPPIRHARVVDAWSGLRPASADALPILGELAPRSWLALGHFRNGILLAPGTARLLRQMVLNQPLSIDAHAFNPGRFHASSE